MWGTPTARDWKDGDTSQLDVPENGLLGRMAANWPTPRSKEDGEYQYSRGDKTKPVPTLSGAAQNWPTPTSLSFADSHQPGNSKSYNETMALAEKVSLASALPDRPISTVGEESSHIRRALNPLFVEWLMGWPRGWTSLALTPPASSDSECSATAFIRWKRHMCSALLQLGLPDDQPVQQSLFG